MVALKEPQVTAAGATSHQWMTEEEFAASFDEDTRAEWIGGEVIVMSPAMANAVAQPS